MKDVILFLVALVLAGLTVWGLKLGYTVDHALGLALGIACLYRVVMVFPEITIAGLLAQQRKRDSTPK